MNKAAPEVRERAVRLLFEHEKGYRYGVDCGVRPTPVDGMMLVEDT